MNLPNVNLNHFVHAYKVAPWRVQRQWIGSALLVVVTLAMIAALYLDVTAQAAIAGREIQDLTAAISVSRQASTDLQTRLASMTTADAMEARAEALGYRSLESGEAEYLVVAGYFKPRPEILSSASLPRLSAPSIPPEYTQSLLDWVDERISRSSARGMQ
jgi:hypothetical protein